MYYVKKQMTVAGSHRLRLNYLSDCSRVHGHNWTITIFCRAEELDENGMVIDFSKIKKRITEVLDHQDLNEVLPFNPTAENIARWVVETIPTCYRAEVIESEGNMAAYEIL